jgi:hypothetical protein
VAEPTLDPAPTPLTGTPITYAPVATYAPVRKEMMAMGKAGGKMKGKGGKGGKGGTSMSSKNNGKSGKKGTGMSNKSNGKGTTGGKKGNGKKEGKKNKNNTSRSRVSVFTMFWNMNNQVASLCSHFLLRLAERQAPEE